MGTGTKKLDKETSDKISFITYMIPYFAHTYKMSMPDAFNYLEKYGGFDFMCEHWWALHTDNAHYAVHDIFTICRQNGGEQ